MKRQPSLSEAETLDLITQSALNIGNVHPENISQSTTFEEMGVTRDKLHLVAEHILDQTEVYAFQGIDRLTQSTTLGDMVKNVLHLAEQFGHEQRRASALTIES